MPVRRHCRRSAMTSTGWPSNWQCGRRAGSGRCTRRGAPCSIRSSLTLPSKPVPTCSRASRSTGSHGMAPGASPAWSDIVTTVVRCMSAHASWSAPTDGAPGWPARQGAIAYDQQVPSNAIHYAYWSGLDDRGAEFWYRSTNGLMAGVFPTNDGACVYVNCRADRSPELRRHLDANYLRFIDESAPDLATRLRAASRTSPVRGTPGLPGFLRRPYGPGWMLVGDAGCTADPASAHGITAALRDAELAAIAIDAGMRDPKLADHAAHAFHAARDRSRPLYELGWAMASYEWDTTMLLDLQASFAAELVREAQETAALPAWSG